MTYLPDLDEVVQELRGVAASIDGQTYDVYRLTSSTSPTGVVSGTPLASSVDARFEKTTDRKEIEMENVVRFLAYKGIVDTTNFLPGDVFVQRTDSYKYERAAYTLISQRAMPRQNIFAATPIYATLTRPESNPNHIDTGRAPQSVPIKAQEWPLTLASGFYSFQRTGTPVTVPIGMVMGRLRDYPRSDTADARLWDDTQRQTWDAWIPVLKGQPLINRDIVTGGNGDRYEITGVQAITSSVLVNGFP